MAAKRPLIYLRSVLDCDDPPPSLSIEELETGLRLLGSGDVDHNAFWDENIEAFRQTVLSAIRDTSDALLSPKITLKWRIQLEGQLEALVQYVELADRYMTQRTLSCERRASELRSRPSRLH